jgi:hypothetical protein
MEKWGGERTEWLRANGYRDYGEYTRSSRWARTRQGYYERHPKECWICSATDGIILHHRTYETIGSEPDEDLVPLCRRCHSLAHWKALPGGLGDRCIYIRLLIEREGMTGYTRLRERYARAKLKEAAKGITNPQAKLLARLQRRADEPYSGAGMTSRRARAEIARLKRKLSVPGRDRPAARTKADWSGLSLRMITSAQRDAFAQHGCPVPEGLTARQARMALAKLERDAQAKRKSGR